MRETTVKSLAVVARRKTYHTGQTVQESWFAPGEFDRLIKAGHLNAVDGPKEESKEPQKTSFDGPVETSLTDEPTKPIQPIQPIEPVEEKELLEEESELEELEELNMGQLRAELKKRNIQFKPSDKKEDLMRLLATGGN